VFRRRNPIPFWQRFWGWLWPRIGWRRLGRYMVKRLIRLPGTPHGIAAGLACGAAVSFTPFAGFHILIGALLALAVRGNVFAVMVGTLIGNPWTFPFMWLASYELGQALLGTQAPTPDVLHDWNFEALIAQLGDLIWPTTVGSIPLGLVFGLAVYFPAVKMITVYQAARRRRRVGRRPGERAPLGSGTTADPGLP
jgi:uncharacterized protein (DUF2062 family)